MTRKSERQGMSFFSHMASNYLINNGVKTHHYRLIIGSALMLTGCPPAEPVSSWG